MFIVTKFVADLRIKLALKEIKKIKRKNIKILDVGCGNCYILNKIKKAGYKHIIGIDIKYSCGIIMDATNMTFSNNSFDVVICFEVIEHCPCVKELQRVLKVGGKLILSTPTPGTDWIRIILVKLGLLEDQDFEGHNYLIDIRKLQLKKIKIKKMLLGTSQFGVFTK